LRQFINYIVNMNLDISQLLEHWDYQPGQVIVRRIKGRDGMEKIQLRVDLGLLQMNAEGRPDGKKPFGHESLLDHYLIQLQKYRDSHGGTEDGYRLKPEDCAKLQQEAIQYHHRYICWYQLEDFEAVVRDADRNLRAFEFVRTHAPSEEISWSLQQFRPQLLMMRARGKGALLLEGQDYDGVLTLIESTVEEIAGFYREHGKSDLAEQSGEIQSLEAWAQDVRLRRPLTEREKLESQLHEAVRREDYETAARCRDALRNLRE
jgi:hypothetical protein